MDDVQDWERRRSNENQAFPYQFPAMPPQFRLLDRLTALFVLGAWACIGLFLLALAFCFVRYLLGEEPAAPVLGAVFVPLALYWMFRLLQHTPGLFWRCPCCKKSFAYWAPRGYSQSLRRQECADKMKWGNIYFHRTKRGALLLPSECPWCGRKFYRPPPK